MVTDPNALSSTGSNKTREAIDQLLGIVSGLVADDDLHDLEIEFLKVWLSEHQDVARVWPGSAIGRAVDTVLADGHVSEEERAYLLTTLKDLASADFAVTDAAGAGRIAIPTDDTIKLSLQDSVVCLAGEFLHGTRAACERLLEQAGAWPVRAVSRNVHYLVVGTKVSSDWLNTPYGRDIQDAVALQQAGHGIAIVSERRWIESIAAVGTASTASNASRK